MILNPASIAVFQRSPASLFFFPRGVIGLVLFCVIIMYLGRELFLVYSAAEFCEEAFCIGKLLSFIDFEKELLLFEYYISVIFWRFD